MKLNSVNISSIVKILLVLTLVLFSLSSCGRNDSQKQESTRHMLKPYISKDELITGTKLSTSIDGNMVTVTELGSNLDGLKFRFLWNSPQIPVIEIIEPSSVPNPSNRITKLSDYFYADENNEGDVDVLMPISILPELTDAGRLVIYHFSQGYGWGAVAFDLRVEEIEGNTYVVLSIGGLKSVMFIGLMPEAVGSTSSNQGD